MKESNVRKLTCPVCRAKTDVVIEPFYETAVCKNCGVNFKVTRELLLLGQPHNPFLPNKKVFGYKLELLEN